MRQLVFFGCAVQRDHSVLPLADLAEGWAAERATPARAEENTNARHLGDIRDIIGTNLTGNFLSHCDSSVRYWDHQAQADVVLARNVQDVSRKASG
jgi:hypothetical protein